jgi:hypothetical protein
MEDNTLGTVFGDAIGIGYCGLDRDRNTDKELEATLRFSPVLCICPGVPVIKCLYSYS